MSLTVGEKGFLFDESIDSADPIISRIIRAEEHRQIEKLIMIPSESMAPTAVRQAMGSVLSNIYAEGYPSLDALAEDESLLGDLEHQLAQFHRLGDRRYYQGTEMANLVEALAIRRVRQLFANDQAGFDEIFANVQPLSGAPANNAIYSALLQHGDTMMGMNLAHGGHLTHGSPVNRSGKNYRVVSYNVNEETGRLDFEQVERLARENRPKLIVAGASAYPWEIDWARLREIADSLPEKCYLVADISHTAGLVVAGLFPNPVGIVDVTSATTHKTMIGPRSAIILTTDQSLARRIDRAVFPGEQGGPHMNTIAAMAVAFGIAQTEKFRELQHQIVANAVRLANELAARGLTIAYGGTNTHLCLVDCRVLTSENGERLDGNVAARFLEQVGIVCNGNTIYGDTRPRFPGAIRLGTPWLSQRGFGEDDMAEIADIIVTVLLAVRPYSYIVGKSRRPAGKIDPVVLNGCRLRVRELIRSKAAGPQPTTILGDTRQRGPEPVLVEVIGSRARSFISQASDVAAENWQVGRWQPATIRRVDGSVLTKSAIAWMGRDNHDREEVWLLLPADRADAALQWLRDLSSGIVELEPDSPIDLLDGPVVVRELSATPIDDAAIGLLTGEDDASQMSASRTYFVGQTALRRAGSAPESAGRPE